MALPTLPPELTFSTAIAPPLALASERPPFPAEASPMAVPPSALRSTVVVLVTVPASMETVAGAPLSHSGTTYPICSSGYALASASGAQASKPPASSALAASRQHIDRPRDGRRIGRVNIAGPHSSQRPYRWPQGGITCGGHPIRPGASVFACAGLSSTTRNFRYWLRGVGTEVDQTVRGVEQAH